MNFLYFNMQVEILIGDVIIRSVKSVKINQSIKQLSDTAVITLPRAMEIISDGRNKNLKYHRLKDYIHAGDPVRIRLGYNDDLKEEFSGYVTEIGADIPTVIRCEDEMWKLRQTSLTKSYKNVDLQILLSDIAPGYSYEIIDNISLGKFRISQASAYDVLRQLREKYGLYARFEGKKLIVGFPVSLKPGQTHKIHLTRNVRAQRGDLKYVSKKDVKVLLRAISLNGDGSRTIAEYGDTGGAVRTLHFTDKTFDQLKELAEKKYKSLSFDGYQGRIPIWGIPVVNAGDAVQITDPAFNGERDGKYLVEGVNVSFNGSSGFKREIQLSLKLA